MATSAMILDQIIGPTEGRDYGAAFASESPPVLRAITRAQATWGDAREALRWACEVRPGNPRVWAILGVADAITFPAVRAEFMQTEVPPGTLEWETESRPDAWPWSEMRRPSETGNKEQPGLASGETGPKR